MKKTMIPAVAPHVTKAAVLLVLEVLPGLCPPWRQDQIYTEITTSMGMTNNKEALIADLKKNLRRRGKHEYEVEAIEDVLIKHYRMWTCT